MNRFISIRWKIVTIAGFVMVVMAALFSWQQQIALSERFTREQQVYGDQMKTMTERLFQVQNDRLQVLARMLAEMPQLRAALRSGHSALARQVLEPMWPELTLGQGLAGLVLFSPELGVMAQWGQADASKLPGLARQAMLRETPQTWLECGGESCLHYVVLPLNEHGVSLGSMALVTGLEGVVIDLRQLGNAEVALLAGPDNAPANAPARPGRAAPVAINPISGLRVLSVSGGAATQATLQAAMQKTWHSPYFVIESASQRWSVLGLQPDLPGDGLLRVGIIVDVSQRINLQRAALWQNALWGAAVLLLSLALLYVLLRPAMNRIGRVSRLLPMLGQSRYQEVQNEIPRNIHPIFRDEMHSLERLSVDLALQLKSLNEADEKQRQALAEQAGMLEKERDFIAGLLDTAPVMIVTYGHDGRLRMANAYTVLDSGLPRERLIGHGFADLFMTPSQRQGFHTQLQSLTPGDVRHGEGNFVRTGAIRDVVWFHSCFDDVASERTYLSVGLDVTEHRQTEERLRLLVERDSVTGLLSRRTFKREFDAMLDKSAKGMVLICDLDEFRSLNDAEGHEAGDRVLMLFAQHIQHMQPSPVLTARLGSDEFAMVFLGLNEADGILLARHLSRFASHQSVLTDAGVASRHLTVSVGLTSFTEDASSADLLLGNAELALAHARAKGHGSWHLYSEQEAYRESADRRTHWRNEVESALEENRFVLHFQPILHISSGDLSHYEALLRMVGQDGKLVPPGMFIDVAESTGLIRRIDRWVVEAAVKAAAHRRDAKIALNLSSRSFDDDMAYETMQAALKQHNVSGERLLLEITETAALANFSGAKRVMDKFLALGCVFGLDDFGVGFSSFQYLKELPVGFVKIDGSFVKNLTRNPDDVVFVRALNSAVQGFGKTTVAEFVEDETSLAILREIGVDYAQGYLIGKPEAEMWSPGQVRYVSPP